MRCRKRNFAFEENVSIFLYTGTAKRLIQQYKFRGYSICAEFFASPVAELCAQRYSGLIVIPVPGRRRARLKRGFDQVEEICRSLMKRYGIPWVKALKRCGSRSQKSLSYEDRLTNLKGKISIRKRALPLPESCILLDDVFTTGATAHECSLVLKENGVKEVHMITLAID